jgi:hypothetical protein
MHHSPHWLESPLRVAMLHRCAPDRGRVATFQRTLSSPRFSVGTRLKDITQRHHLRLRSAVTPEPDDAVLHVEENVILKKDQQARVESRAVLTVLVLGRTH